MAVAELQRQPGLPSLKLKVGSFSYRTPGVVSGTSLRLTFFAQHGSGGGGGGGGGGGSQHLRTVRLVQVLPAKLL